MTRFFAGLEEAMLTETISSKEGCNEFSWDVQVWDVMSREKRDDNLCEKRDKFD